jgi:hypothetical protein
MPEATQYIFNHKELTTLLVKHQGLHEGLWQLSVSFGFAAANAGPGPADVNPAAIVLVTGIGLTKAAERNPLCVDAADVNPAETSKG